MISDMRRMNQADCLQILALKDRPLESAEQIPDWVRPDKPEPVMESRRFKLVWVRKLSEYWRKAIADWVRMDRGTTFGPDALIALDCETGDGVFLWVNPPAKGAMFWDGLTEDEVAAIRARMVCKWALVKKTRAFLASTEPDPI